MIIRWTTVSAWKSSPRRKQTSATVPGDRTQPARIMPAKIHAKCTKNHDLPRRTGRGATAAAAGEPAYHCGEAQRHCTEPAGGGGAAP